MVTTVTFLSQELQEGTGWIFAVAELTGSLPIR
jgi:hypothetical protein